MIAQTLAVSALVAATFAAPAGGSETGSCNTGLVSCCDTTKDAQKSTGEESGLLHTGDVLDQVAVQCTQIPLLIGVALQDECKNTPVSLISSKVASSNKIPRSVVKRHQKMVSSVSTVLQSHSSKLDIFWAYLYYIIHNSRIYFVC